LKLDSFDGSGSPVEVVDWLTYVEDKMNAFEVVYGDCVRYGTHLLRENLDLVERCADSLFIYTWLLDLGCFCQIV
jgi:hypothetical protein